MFFNLFSDADFYISQLTGIKMVLGYALVLLFVVTYRQLYSPISLKAYSFWLTAQIGIIVILSLSYHPNNLFLGFFPANFIGWYATKKYFYRAQISFVVVLSLTTLIVAIQGLMAEMLYFSPFYSSCFFLLWHSIDQ
ncbi:hypothetical protein ACI2OX_18925 [Bacillus sp. N9]